MVLWSSRAHEGSAIGGGWRSVLGVVAAGQRVPVFGPVKHPLFSAGIGYVVPLVDARASAAAAM
jgi:hypothetical protein